MSSFQLKPRGANNFVMEFREVAESIVSILAAHGTRVLPYQAEELVYFSCLETSQQKAVVGSISNYMGILEMTVRQGHSLRNSKHLVWNAFKALGLLPSSGLLNHIESNRVVEIYHVSGVQVFRNLEFLDVCSYSLEDIYCRPWPTLYKRPPDAEEKLMHALGQAFAGNQPQLCFPQGTRHELVESESIDRHHLDYELNMLASVLDQSGKLDYYLVVESVGIIAAQRQCTHVAGVEGATPYQ